MTIEKCNEGGGYACVRPAEYIVEKKAELFRHRGLKLCAEHAEKYRDYPDDFSVTKIEKGSKR